MARPNGASARNGASGLSSSRKEIRAARTLTATAPNAARPTSRGIAVETHIVQPGDSFAALARRYYGSERYTDYLLKSNPQVSDPKRLKVGASVRIPPRPMEGAAAGATLARAGSTRIGPVRSAHGVQGAGRTYRVREGDSFYAIARDQLGDASRWRELFELNKARVNGDPTSLRAGQQIVLPEK